MWYKLFLFLLLSASLKLFSQNIDSTQFSMQNPVLDSLLADTTGLAIDSSKFLETEKLEQIFQQPFSNQSYFITKTDILRNDYRYTGDFFKVFPFSFERSYGFIGQPNDIYLYGVSSSSTSYFIDGVPIIVSDFNHIQSEDIDSIEIVPLPRGFLYGFATNPVSVNFISKDIIPTKPYSRIKYYEGPFGEAFVDGMFSMNLFKDLFATVNVTNRKVDDSFKNSAFSIWQAKVKLRYNLSNHVNLIGSYYFSKSTTGINGGVNVDEIRQTTLDINSILYNETLAPVYYENNSLDFKQHNFGLKFLAKTFENAITDFNLYYKFNQEQFFQKYSGYNASRNTKNKIFGASLRQRFGLKVLSLDLLSGFQILKDNQAFASSDSLDPTHFLIPPPSLNRLFYITPQVNVPLFDSIMVASVYAKYLRSNKENSISGDQTIEMHGGVGSDLNVNFNNGIEFYVGYSNFDNSLLKTNTKTLEIRSSYKKEDYSLSINAFNQHLSSSTVSGIGIGGSYKLWKILLEGRFSQYFFKQGNEYEFFNLPKANFSFGFFFKDSLFNSNLDLRAGFLCKYTGRQDLQHLIIPWKGFASEIVPAALTLDFTLSAEIQKTAIVYFTWENLFDKEYYITPYYPMLERNIRFGIAWEIFN